MSNDLFAGSSAGDESDIRDAHAGRGDAHAEFNYGP